ncbi:MAG: MlaD family protein [Oligoflexia bacterium]|nr:MlaD family protein [Oligoflexia bacterium]
MDRSKKVEFKVGVFVTIGLLLTLFFIIALGGDKTFFQKHITLHMRVDETMGLSLGSAIQIAGVPSGNVKLIEFDRGSNKLDIHLRIEQKFAGRITKGSFVGLRTQGALGDKYITITPGPYDGEPLRDGDTIDVELGSDLLTTLSKSGNRVEQAFDILDQVERLVKALNDRNLAQNLADTVQNLKSTSHTMDQVMASIKGSDPKNNNLKKSVDRIAVILEKIDSGQGTLGGLINDPTVHEDLKALLGGAKRSKLLKYLIRSTIEKSEETDSNSSKEKDK